ncbi:hypothetical protein ACFLYY_01245, partial [Patescibacteria group bacterium]
MKYDKINFLYKTPSSPLASQMFSKFLEDALRRNKLLYYAYDLSGKKFLNKKELLKYPILCVNASQEPLFSIVKSISGQQFIAEINSEPLFRGDHYKDVKKMIVPKFFRIGKYLKMIKSAPSKRYKEFLEEFKMLLRVNILGDHLYPYKLLKKRSKYFDLFFSHIDEDIDKYFGKPCYWYAIWVDTRLLDDIAKP